MTRDTGTASTTLERTDRRLGEFLAAVRARVAPPAASVNGRRRTRGLRREEVALRAGISVTWYTWLEQGRKVRPSAATLRSIAAALEMTPAERAHLLDLAPADPAEGTAPTAAADGALLLLVETLAPHPAYAVNGRWDLLAVNRPAVRVFGRFDTAPGTSDNILRRLFLDPKWKRGFGDWEGLCASAVAQFRPATAAQGNDLAFRRFLTALQGGSPHFASLWGAQQVEGGRSHEKRFHHPRLGTLRFHYSSVAPDGAPPDIRVIVYRPADPPTRRVLKGAT